MSLVNYYHLEFLFHLFFLYNQILFLQDKNILNVIDIGQALFDLEADIGERSKKEIEEAIDNNDKTTLKKLLKQVGPGEWRWKIRTKLNEIQKYSNRN